MAACTIGQASGERAFVIGDLHGCSDEPESLLKHLETQEGLGENDVLIFLGDYIDRGPNSRGVINLMLDMKRRFPKTRFLKGNHEDMLLDFLGFGGRLGHAFLYNGGLETIQSYDISVFAPPDEMVAALPAAHFKFLCDLESMIEIGNYVCVHAGLNPLRKYDDQVEADALWIRDEFIANNHPFEKQIVFGHTPHQQVLLHLPYKIGLDTGLVFGNKLSCLELYSGALFQIDRGTSKVKASTVKLS